MGQVLSDKQDTEFQEVQGGTSLSALTQTKLEEAELRGKPERGTHVWAK